MSSLKDGFKPENSVTDIKTQTVYAGFPDGHQYGSRTALYKFV